MKEKSFGKRIYTLRKERGLTQAELASAIAISRISVGNYENEDRTPGAEEIKKLAQYFCCSSDYLLCLSESKQPENSVIAGDLGLSDECIEALRRLNTGSSPLFSFNSLITAPSFSAFLALMQILSTPQLLEILKSPNYSFPKELGVANEHDLMVNVATIRMHAMVDSILKEIRSNSGIEE